MLFTVYITVIKTWYPGSQSRSDAHDRLLARDNLAFTLFIVLFQRVSQLFRWFPTDFLYLGNHLQAGTFPQVTHRKNFRTQFRNQPYICSFTLLSYGMWVKKVPGQSLDIWEKQGEIKNPSCVKSVQLFSF